MDCTIHIIARHNIFTTSFCPKYVRFTDSAIYVRKYLLRIFFGQFILVGVLRTIGTSYMTSYDESVVKNIKEKIAKRRAVSSGEGLEHRLISLLTEDERNELMTWAVDQELHGNSKTDLLLWPKWKEFAEYGFPIEEGKGKDNA